MNILLIIKRLGISIICIAIPNPDEPEPKRSHAKTQSRQDLINALPLRALRLCERIFFQKCKEITTKTPDKPKELI